MPRVAIGIPLHGHERFVSESIGSLFEQSYRDVGFMLLDDASPDRTGEIASSLVAGDPRAFFACAGTRLGLIEAWRRVYALAYRRFPQAEYFAWASDHDTWDTDWLSALVTELDEHPEAVLAYPQNIRVTAAGEPVRGPWSFDTTAAPTPWTRLRSVATELPAGDAIYGLFRRDALARAGSLPAVIGPDRLLLAQLALLGEFRQVRRVLWRRRFVEPVSPAGQRRTLFARPASPLHTHLPWPAVHGAILFWKLGIRGEGEPAVGHLQGAAAAVSYAVRTSRSAGRAATVRTVHRLSASARNPT